METERSLLATIGPCCYDSDRLWRRNPHRASRRRALT